MILLNSIKKILTKPLSISKIEELQAENKILQKELTKAINFKKYLTTSLETIQGRCEMLTQATTAFNLEQKLHSITKCKLKETEEQLKSLNHEYKIIHIQSKQCFLTRLETLIITSGLSIMIIILGYITIYSI